MEKTGARSGSLTEVDSQGHVSRMKAAMLGGGPIKHNKDFCFILRMMGISYSQFLRVVIFNKHHCGSSNV